MREGTSVPRLSRGYWDRNVRSRSVKERRRLGLYSEAVKAPGRKRLAAMVIAGRKVERKSK